MKIAILLLSGGVVERGAETSAHVLANIFSTLGHKVTVFQVGKTHNNNSDHFNTISIALPMQPSGHKPITVVGKITERMNLNKRGLATLLFSLKSLPYLAKGKFDLVVPIDGFWEIIICKALQLFKSFKIMVIGLAGIGWTDAQNLKLKPDIFIALTEPMHDWAARVQSKLKIVTIPLPIDTKMFNESIAPAHITLKKPVILTVAALTKYKRIDAVIQAVALLPEWSLLIIGQGEEWQRLQQLGEKLLGDRFQILEVPHSQIAAYYRACDVFVLASESQEAFGMVLLEAQACGLPIITTNDPSRRYILGESALYVDPENAKEFAALIANASTMYDKVMSDQNLESYREQNIAAQYKELLDTLNYD